jgi:AraC-like DNA-binding protein
MRLTHHELAVLPQGRIQTCPHGFTELVVPVLNGVELLGVLFAGPCWFKRCKGAGTGLPVAPSRAWLEDRLLILGGIAVRVWQLLVPEDKTVKRVGDRRLRIEAFIRDQLVSKVTLEMLAKALSLSPSRTSHAVRQVFGKSFSVVLCEARMRVGAQLLVTSDLPVADIAMKVGCEDPNYFSRLFSRHFGCPPRAYRERCRIV